MGTVQLGTDCVPPPLRAQRGPAGDLARGRLPVAMARGSIPVPPDLPVTRIWILSRPVWRERRSGVMQQLKANACALVRSGEQGDGALHQRSVAREAAEERGAVAQLGDTDRDSGLSGKRVKVRVKL